ncbi:MAG: hypothetical protein WCH34_05925 [Bacteroidota bacterium]
MTEPILEHKLIVTTNQKGMTTQETLQDSKDKYNAAIANPTIVPNLDPTPTEVNVEILKLVTFINEQDALRTALKGKTSEVNSQVKLIKNIFVSRWANEIQNADEITVAKVKKMKFGVKGVDDGHSEPEWTVENSLPSIIKVINTSSLHYELEIINDGTKGVGLPKGADGLYILLFIGDTEPTDISQMQNLGMAGRGKFPFTFPAAKKGLNAFFSAAYLNKKNKRYMGMCACKSIKIA